MLADIELIGIPHRLVLGDRALQSGKIEYRRRGADDNEDLELANIINTLKQRMSKP